MGARQQKCLQFNSCYGEKDICHTSCDPSALGFWGNKQEGGFTAILILKTEGPSRLFTMLQFSSVQFSRSVTSDSLRPHESQHTRPPCSSPTPGVHSDSCPSSQWCHPAISSSVVPFSSCPQSLPFTMVECSIKISEILVKKSSEERTGLTRVAEHVTLPGGEGAHAFYFI